MYVLIIIGSDHDKRERELKPFYDFIWLEQASLEDKKR